ncbi:MAG: tRNA pseudouridine(55) synthase TruB [Ardenticatenaceae bacterium]|nr:tRNA pseudouridine(55) synthase TruB [Ardenticatenaceae bacterium]MCB8987471.1 tRNA pseudouridine(55) synthase TruB [Ardenticatenaceae bacterium]
MSTITGILTIDKPIELSSHDVVARVRRLSGTRRVGHAGTLDPLATGVLLLGIGRATRLLEYLVGLPKTYETTLRLGQTTNTYDAEGEIVDERPYTHLTLADVQAVLPQFRGPIQQKPPMYSAIKKDGRPLYKLARQGQEVDVPAREVTIYELAVQAWQPPELRLRVACSSGAYVRSLGHDMGQALGCGAYLTALRRTAVGDFTLAQAVALADLTSLNLTDYVLPPEAAVATLPRLHLPAPEVERLLLGQRLARESDHALHSLVRVMAEDGRLLGILRAEDGYWQPHKMFPPETAVVN